MASLLAIGGKALVNALAFSGTNAAFSMLGDHGRAEAAMKFLFALANQIKQKKVSFSACLTVL